MDKRNLVAFGLIFLLILIWTKRMEQREAERRRLAVATAEQTEAQPETPTATPAEPAKATPAPPVEQAEVKSFEIEGADGLQSVSLTNAGACLTRVRLTRYYRELGKPEPLTVIEKPQDAPAMPGALALLDPRDPERRLPLDATSYAVTPLADGATFTAAFAGGVRVTKTIRAAGEPYALAVTVRVENTSQADIPNFQYEIVAGSRIVSEYRSPTPVTNGFFALSRRGDASYEHHGAQDALKRQKKGEFITGRAADAGQLASAGVANRYFAAALTPLPGRDQVPWVRDARIVGVEAVDPKDDAKDGERAPNIYVTFVTHPDTLRPGEPWVHEYRFFAGPKDPQLLSRYPILAGVIDYGSFGAIARLLERILRFFHSIVGNWGFSIMLLTLLVRFVLFPLSWKSQVAMQKMQKLQPVINLLKEKYKHDKQRLAKEQMDLMRRHGANPLTGCLPIFLQLPVFFGLFNMIQNAITLRHQPFLLWVRDLAAPDAAHFGGGVVVNVLPILMVVTWVVQQKMMPKPQDPQQQATYKMMMFMPIIFGFMLYNFASGMSLYWLTSTLLAIVEQKAIKAYIRKHHSAPLDLPESLVEEAAAAGAPVGEEEADAEAVVEGGRPPALKRPPKRRGGRRRR